MFRVSCSLTWLLVAITMSSSFAQSTPAVLDTAGKALLPGVEYCILPADQGSSGGALTLISRNGSCPLYVGQADKAESNGLPVIFKPFFADDAYIAEYRDLRILFSATTTCVKSNAWLTGGTEPETARRLIATGTEREGSNYGGFFKISKNEGDGYNIEWCPTDVCPTCRFICGFAGVFVNNGKSLLALDGPSLALPLVFQRL